VGIQVIQPSGDFHGTQGDLHEAEPRRPWAGWSVDVCRVKFPHRLCCRHGLSQQVH